MNCLTLEPPNTQYSLVIGKIKKLLLEISDKTKPICVGGAKPEEVENYQAHGFTENFARKCMIRPTEGLTSTLDPQCLLVPMSSDRMSEMVQVFNKTYKEVKYQHTNTLETFIEDINYYFQHFDDNPVLKNASSLIIDRESHQILGICLISLWEDWPNVFEIVVDPAFQGRGLGRFMLYRALSALEAHYPVLRLFVTMGNEAEVLYTNIGFHSGLVTTEMQLEV